MTTSRGRANHSLYLARILVQGWQDTLSAEALPASTLSQAYLPGVRGHLADAYGWFLLEITRPGAIPDSPPHCIADLPEIAEGKALPGEIRELQQFEGTGWIGEMLDSDRPGDVARSPGNLASSGDTGPDDASRWAASMQQLFDRMGDSLDEY